jgi:hypothetical protein
MKKSGCPKKITYDIVHAAGWDAGNRNMKKHGRKKWSEADFNAAVRELNRLIRCKNND